jgi:hypothetical protein
LLCYAMVAVLTTSADHHRKSLLPIMTTLRSHHAGGDLCNDV